MGRGVSCGGGQSSLGYLFGNGEADGNAPPPPENPSDDATTEPSKTEPSDDNNSTATNEPSEKPLSESANKINQNPDANAHDSTTNNYHRADGQNCGNFITNRPSTKVHAAPGGSSSLGYLFNDDKK